ncbi:MAG TPA: hypothetical protein V6C78_13660 [Crinalium sp.]
MGASPPARREFDSPILQARRACKIGLLRGWRDAPSSQKPDRRIHVSQGFHPCIPSEYQ